MANIERTIEIIFQGTDNISREISNMGSNIESFGSDLQDIGQPFADATEKVLLLNAAIAAIAVAGIKASSDLEEEANKMKNSLGLPIEEVERFEEIAEEVYKGGFGDDLAEVFEAVTLAQKKLGDNADTDIGKVTTAAFKLKKTFDVDVEEALSAVRTLMKNFGIDSETALDFIAKGFQEGLNTSDDFLESVTEYSTQFANGGAKVTEFFSVLQTGVADGILGTDKAADAFKEFRVRIIDDSNLTREGLENLGFDPDKFIEEITKGEKSAIDAFGEVQEAMKRTEDKTVAFNAGVALMGTQFEDLGDTAVGEIDITKTKIEDLSGAMDNIDTGTFEEKFVAALRTVQIEFGDMTLWDNAKDKIIEVFEGMAESLGPALDNADFSGLEDSVGEVWDSIAAIFTDNDFDLTSVEGMSNAIQLIIETLETTADVTNGIVEALDPIIDIVIDIVEKFNSMDSGTKELVGNLLGIGAALTTIGGVVSAGGALIGGIGTLAGLLAQGGSLALGVGNLALAFGGPLGLALGIGAVATAVAAFTMGDMKSDFSELEQYLIDNHEKVDELMEGILELDSTTATAHIYALIEEGELEEAERLLDEAVEKERIAKIKAQVEQEEFETFVENLSNMSSEVESEILVKINQGKFDEVEGMLDDIGEGREVEIEVEVDGEEIEDTKTELEWFDGDGKRHTIEVETDDSDVDETKQEIEDIPTEKELEIILQGEIDTQLALIETKAETVQAAMEWTAKVDIAEAEAAAEQVKAAFESVNSSVTSTSEAASSMYDSLISNMNDLSTSDKWAMQDVLEEQMEMEQQSLDMQKDLIEAQIKLMEAKADAIDDGDGLIKIESSGLEPALEMVMWQILEKVQVKASEEEASFLLGI